MVAPVKITQSSVALKIPATSELVEGGLAVNVSDGALYSARHDGSIIRIEGDTGNGTIASGASIALGAVMAGVVDVTGTTTIATIVLREGQARTVRFVSALTITNSATLVLPGGVNIVSVAGDFATFRGYAGGITRCTNYAFSPTDTASCKLVAKAPGNGSTSFNLFLEQDNGLDGYLMRCNSTNGNLIFTRRDTTGTVNTDRMTLDTVGNLTVVRSITALSSFGCNGQAAQVSFPLGAAASDLTTAIALVNNLRTMSINNGTGL